MFIVNITYKTSLDIVNQHLEKHIDFLNKHYTLGHFKASGKKVPRTGGIILSKVSDRNKLEQILAEDPFNKENIANYELIEFIPSKTSEDFKILKEID